VLVLGSLLALVAGSGASCPRVVQQYTQPIPRALPESATLTQIVDLVNDNSARVQSLSATRASISSPGMPSLSAHFALQKPRSFRLIAEKFGPQVDLGSNDELFWLWLRSSPPPALYFCRHDQFATSAARQLFPVEPEWIVEAFGLITFDPAANLEGPQSVGNGRVQIRSRGGSPGMETTRITVIDASRALVLEQHAYDARGALLASAVLSKHALDPASGAKLPRHINIQWPSAKLDLTLDMSEVQVNQLPTDPRELFARPTYPGYSEIDLAQPGLQLVPVPDGQARAAPQARY
jgi:hypothetical protein